MKESFTFLNTITIYQIIVWDWGLHLKTSQNVGYTWQKEKYEFKEFHKSVYISKIHTNLQNAVPDCGLHHKTCQKVEFSGERKNKS